MLLKASPTAESDRVRRSRAAAPSGSPAHSRQAADSARRTTPRCSTMPWTSSRSTCQQADRTHVGLIMESPAALYTTDEADAQPTVASSSVTPSVQLIKRTLDVVLALIGLALTVPFYPLIMLAILLDSRGPVFYRQRRAGRLIGRGAQGRELQFDDFAI